MALTHAGYAVGDSRGPDAFFEGADFIDAATEAKQMFPESNLLYDGDLDEVARDLASEDVTPNLKYAEWPSFAMQQFGLSPVSASEFMSMDLQEAHRRLRPFFRKYEQGPSGEFVPAGLVGSYATVEQMRRRFLTYNAKLTKGARKAGVAPGLSAGPNLIPHRKALEESLLVDQLKRRGLKGLGLCAGSSKQCRETCLVYAGRNVLADKQSAAKLSRTEALVLEPVAWLRMFHAAIEFHIDWCTDPSIRRRSEIGVVFGRRTVASGDRKKLESWDDFVRRVGDKTINQQLVPYVRPNVLSDIPWELFCPDIFDLFPDMDFYDYTKVPGRQELLNYDLTFSLSGDPTNEKWAMRELSRSMRLAVVFWIDKKRNPDLKLTDLTFWGRPVLDGDKHDFRPLDPPGSVIGLTYKPVEIEGVKYTKPPPGANKFVVPTFFDDETGQLIVAGTPATQGAELVFRDAGATLIQE